MPNRIIKESVCTSDSVDELSWFEEVFFYRLLVNCDDYGRMDARPAVLKARLFPLKDRMTTRDCSVALQKLLDIGVVKTYVCEGKPYLYLVNWESHQSIRAKKSKYPDPSKCENMNADEIICKQMNADAPVIQSNTNPNPNTNTNSAGRQRSTRFEPPSVEEVSAYCSERGNNVDAEHFVAYYSARDWKVGGKTKMTDWKAAVITWEKKEFNSAPKKKLNYESGNRAIDNDEKAAILRMMEEE